MSGGTIKTIVGKDGINGQDGITPHIDPTTKHWFVGDTDTGIVAKGKDGTDGIQGIRGEKYNRSHDCMKQKIQCLPLAFLPQFRHEEVCLYQFYNHT